MLLTGLDIIAGNKQIKANTALGIDHWEGGFLRAMPEEFADRLATLLNRVEGVCAWPWSVLMSIITLMGKPNGGVRPIALLPMLYRQWTKARKPAIDLWDMEHQGVWDAAVRGSSALRAAVLTLFGDEVATYSGEQVARMLWDLDKFYDSINISLLIDRAVEMGYPMVALALGIQMHMAPRVFRGHQHYQLAPMPSNAISAISGP